MLPISGQRLALLRRRGLELVGVGRSMEGGGRKGLGLGPVVRGSG